MLCVFEQSIVASVEEREHNEGRDDLDRGLRHAQSEAGLLSTGLAEVGQAIQGAEVGLTKERKRKAFALKQQVTGSTKDLAISKLYVVP